MSQMQENPTKKRIRVAAAVIVRTDTDGTARIFATQRGYGEWKDWWEFPGGKIEPGEKPEETVVREIREELGVGVTVSRFLCSVEYEYPAFHLSMDCFVCALSSGTEEPQLLEHESAAWLSVRELDTLRWLPADVTVVEQLKLSLKS